MEMHSFNQDCSKKGVSQQIPTKAPANVCKVTHMYEAWTATLKFPVHEVKHTEHFCGIKMVLGKDAGMK